MEPKKNWYVIHTRPKLERRIVDLLEKKKITCYYPVCSQQQEWHAKRKTVSSPLFPSMLFVHISEFQRSTVEKTDGVNGLLYWHRSPATVSDQEIKAIRHFIETHTDIKLEKIKMSSVGAPGGIEIGSGNTNVFEIENGLDEMLLPSLGYVMKAVPFEANIRVVA